QSPPPFGRPGGRRRHRLAGAALSSPRQRLLLPEWPDRSRTLSWIPLLGIVAPLRPASSAVPSTCTPPPTTAGRASVRAGRSDAVPSVLLCLATGLLSRHR